MKHLFIISLPRTGSTLLQKMLMAHHEISSIAEPNILLPLVFTTKLKGTLTNYSHWVTYYGIRDLINNLPGKQNDYFKFIGEFTDKIYSSVTQTDKSYFLDKTPRYYFIIPEIVKIFPDAKFIFLFRNPIQIYASILLTWSKNRFYLAKRNRFYVDLMEGMDRVSKGYEMLASRSYAIQYEQFVKDPESHLKGIMTYLDLNYEEQMLQSFSKQDLKGGNVDPTGKKYKKVETETLEKWKTVFNTPYRKSVLKKYIKSIDDHTLLIQGYNKTEILQEIDQLKTKGNRRLIQDIIDHNKTKFRNKFNRLAYE